VPGQTEPIHFILTKLPTRLSTSGGHLADE